MRACLILLVALLLPSVGTAQPHVTGFGDSITDLDFDPFPNGSYLAQLDPSWTIEDQGEAGDLSSDVRDRLQSWLDDENTADVVVVLAGTVDTAQKVGFFAGPYDESETVATILEMLEMLRDAGIPAILATPLPILPPCDDTHSEGGPTCSKMNSRAAGLAVQLGLTAASNGFPFVDLYQLYQDAEGGPDPWLRPDGIHPNLAGDAAIAAALEPQLYAILFPAAELPAVPALSPPGLTLLLVALAGAGGAAVRQSNA